MTDKLKSAEFESLVNAEKVGYHPASCMGFAVVLGGQRFGFRTALAVEIFLAQRKVRPRDVDKYLVQLDDAGREVTHAEHS